MDIKHAAPSALPSSWTILQTVNMKDHGRKSSWTTQLSPYLRGLKMKNIIPSPMTPQSPKSPQKQPDEGDSVFQIIHTPDRPERPISRTAIPDDEQCMKFLMSLQRQEEHKRGGMKKTGLAMWPYPEKRETEDRRCLRSVRVESVHVEEARLARTNSSGPARVVEVGRSSTKSTVTTRRSSHSTTPSVSDAEENGEPIEEARTSTYTAPLSPPPTLSRNQSRLDTCTPRANTSRWSDDSVESLFSSRDQDSPCPQRDTLRSSVEVSSPTVFGDDSVEPFSPTLLMPVKDRPATLFTDPRLRAMAGPITPPPSARVAQFVNVSPEPALRKYSWRSSRETILNTAAPISRFQSWSPEVLPKVEARKQQLHAEPEVYGDWADYYFEDGNFWHEYSDGDSDADDDQTDREIGEHEAVVEDENHTGRLGVDNGDIYPQYESFIEDYNANVMSITVAEV
ncbi:hypothetical protein CTA2_5234 [Colletotrichum tanaceti]|uniref:Uncharacterized protein n=1 Tax=Colletotrichum tanaceti TaxID=1306861 RepID=A0A4U6XQR2_9PEZI|nr:hypothetical protein CTA2_5234 [Colletotrichum tanaceti]TKW58185.1 hypothetical protein CTA1_7870 [Colletotrichum tanaceti]